MDGCDISEILVSPECEVLGVGVVVDILGSGAVPSAESRGRASGQGCESKEKKKLFRV